MQHRRPCSRSRRARVSPHSTEFRLCRELHPSQPCVAACTCPTLASVPLRAPGTVPEYHSWWLGPGGVPQTAKAPFCSFHFKWLFSCSRDNWGRVRFPWHTSRGMGGSAVPLWRLLCASNLGISIEISHVHRSSERCLFIINQPIFIIIESGSNLHLYICCFFIVHQCIYHF